MSVDSPASAETALLIEVTGIVQGVGFRPFVHRCAVRHGLQGWIRNESGCVRIAVRGTEDGIAAFINTLRDDHPPLAEIDMIDTSKAPAILGKGFEILPSLEDPKAQRVPISPDTAICPACYEEFTDPSNRRYRYPFITCTDCGPRFTIINDMPYDRERTSMVSFPQCPACETEYLDPTTRRFHCESNSCPACGPSVLFETAGKTQLEGEHAISVAGTLLKRGKVLALRGLGGFHLAADATDENAVRSLRSRKAREAKPLAVMVRTIEDAKNLVQLNDDSKRWLESRQAPIVLVAKLAISPLAPSVAPGLGVVGIMLAYTPLHHLLLEAAGRPLVMTSGNFSQDPIATGNDEARERLSRVADGFLIHDRDIVARYDDSVIRPTKSGPAIVIRRARGFAPIPLKLPFPTPMPLVAVGPHLKNTFTVAEHSKAYVSQHIGDLENIETLEHFKGSLETFKRLFDIHPRVAVRDLHPGYLSTKVADELELERTISVQHHHAHIAAVAAEHDVTEAVIGLACDGTGYGEDAHIWGAEALIANLTGYRRVGHLRYAPLPGGDRAVRDIWRVAFGYFLLEPGLEDVADHLTPPRHKGSSHIVKQQINLNINCPLQSSLGRLFDAAAVCLGVRATTAFEGQAAMELEALAGHFVGHKLPYGISFEDDGTAIVDPLPMLAALVDGSRRRVPAEKLAAAFHDTVVSFTIDLAKHAREVSGITTAALGGGVFQNARLLETVIHQLKESGFEVLCARNLGPNDGAISYGQAAVAAAIMTHESGD